MRHTFTALLAASLLPIMASTQAQARPSTKSFTCQGAKNFVHQRGAVVMNHKASNLYRRFVSHRGFCDYDESTRLFGVPTKSGRCSLKICEPRIRYNDN